MAKITIPAKLEYLGEVIQFVTKQAASFDFEDQKIFAIELATEEAVMNIINNAYPDKSGDLEVECYEENESLVIEIRDNGIPFDLFSAEDPDITADIEERQVGGLGIFLIKKTMDHVKYRRESNSNILTLTVHK